MSWVKKGFIFNANKHFMWAHKGALIPTPFLVDSNIVRVFVTFCDEKGIGRTGYVDLDANNLNNVLAVSSKPIFDIGLPGTFDENGSLTCSVIKTPDGNLHFYYAGFELGHKIRYRLLSGLVITDPKLNIIKKYCVPILERSDTELYFRGGPFCIYNQEQFCMWYVAGSKWIDINSKPMPVYEIKYIESKDGVNWPSEGRVCIKISEEDEHGFGRPYVIFHNSIYKMFYSIRKKEVGYRLGYAESRDGINWKRRDSCMDSLNELGDSWDSKMICYSAVIELNGKLIMFYNGNNFGESGFGYAEFIP